MSFRIALNFEDDVTRFIDCAANERVLEAADRHNIRLPKDCEEGYCGTCKCSCETGSYDLGKDYIETALTEEEAAARLVLTCQMLPRSDCVVAVPVPSTACKTAAGSFEATISAVKAHSDTVVELELTDPSVIPAFLPGQYVNLLIPNTDQARPYSFSSAPGSAELRFLIRLVPGGRMSTFLKGVTSGERVTLAGPQGSFYLRDVARPILMLAGGTGLAPFLSMLASLEATGCDYPVHMIYGVTHMSDLVVGDRLEAFQQSLSRFTFEACVADEASGYPRVGNVTDFLDPKWLYDGDIDVYACGPPPMVEAVAHYFETHGLKPFRFQYEKFAQNPTLIADQAI